MTGARRKWCLAIIGSSDVSNPRSVVFLEDMLAELSRARDIHVQPLNSHHEAWAVILEELDEFREEMRKQDGARDHVNAYRELVQTAAMCMRAAQDLHLDEAY
jgi:hypothetical protein